MTPTVCTKASATLTCTLLNGDPGPAAVGWHPHSLLDGGNGHGDIGRPLWTTSPQNHLKTGSYFQSRLVASGSFNSLLAFFIPSYLPMFLLPSLLSRGVAYSLHSDKAAEMRQLESQGCVEGTRTRPGTRAPGFPVTGTFCFVFGAC